MKNYDIMKNDDSWKILHWIHGSTGHGVYNIVI